MDQLKGIQIDTPLSQAFFSKQNIQNLLKDQQNLIKCNNVLYVCEC